MGIAGYFCDVYLSGLGSAGTMLNHFILALFLSVLFSPRTRGWKGLAYGGLSFVLNWFIVVIWGSLYYWLAPGSDYGYLITPLPVAVTVVLIYRRSAFVDRLLRACMYVSVTTLITAIAFPVVRWERSMFPWDTAAVFEKLLRMAVALPLFNSLRRNKVGKLENVSPYFPLLMLAISSIGYAVNAVGVFVLKLPSEDMLFSFNFFLSLGLLTVEVLSYFMFYRAIRDYNEKRLLSLEQQRVQSELDMLRDYELSYNRVRMVRHDIQNQYAYVGALLESGEIARAIDYFRGLNYLVEGLKQNVYCQHKIINLTLNLAGERAAAEMVRLDINVSVPAQMGISDVTLTSILTNLLDNSIEACKTLEEEKRLVSVSIMMNRNYLLIRVSNPVRPEAVQIKDGRLITTKRDKDKHGYGTQIVRKYAEANGGCVEYGLEGETFVADVMLRSTPGRSGGEQDEE